MPQEIERKFLVKSDDFKSQAFKQTRIIQAYLSSAKGRSVRVRIKGEKAFITVKGASNETGVSRYEWEKEISVADANELLQICEPGVIDKTRYEVKCGKHVWEVDEFYNDNEGLVVAEIELGSEQEAFEKPEWVGEEVTGIKMYYNSKLRNFPFSQW